MASTTKIMTATIIIENCNLEETVEVSKKAANTGGSRLGLKTGDKITIKDLLYGLMLRSGNDAAVALAEVCAGSIVDFSNLMNKKANELGLVNTHFESPHGLDSDGHYTTAYELALLSDYALKNKTFIQIVGTSNFTISINGYPKSLTNTNELLGNLNGVYGIKTGFTTQAKNCLIAGAKKDGIELIAVMLGAEATENGQSGRYVDAKNLFNFGFENYEIKKFLNEGTKVAEIKVKNATKDTQTLNLIANASLSTTFQSNFDTTSLIPSIEIKENISAPIAKDAILGKISYNIDGIIYEADLIAENDVIKSNFIETLLQILLAIIVLILIAEFFSHKRKKQKNNKKNLRKNSSVYKFNLE